MEEVFWRVRLKPGKPLWFGRRGATLVFGLPGQPALHRRLLAALRRPGAAPAAGRDRRRAAARPGAPRGARRARRRPHDAAHRRGSERGADGVLEATPTEGQGSHLTGALAASDGFVVVPHRGGEQAAGARVDAILL